MSDAATPVVIASVPADATPFGEPVTAQTRFLLGRAVAAAGHPVAEVIVRQPADLDTIVVDHPGALVMNLCYGLRTAGATLDQPAMAAALEQAGMDLVGSGAEAQRRCQDKLATAEVAAEIGVAAPRLLTVADAVGESGPLVVKPRCGAAHRDVRLVATGSALAAEPPGEDMIVQEYVDGPEYSIGVIDQAGTPHALPAARLRHRRTGAEPAVYDWGTTTVAPDSAHRFGLSDAARALFEALGLRHYARFDFRVAPGGRLVLLDANALPSLAPRQLLATSARWEGRRFPDLVAGIVAAAERDRRTAARSSSASVG